MTRESLPVTREPACRSREPAARFAGHWSAQATLKRWHGSINDLGAAFFTYPGNSFGNRRGRGAADMLGTQCGGAWPGRPRRTRRPPCGKRSGTGTG